MNLLLALTLLSLDYRPAFLDIPISARAAALGGSYVAAGSDAAAVFYNPAAVSQDGLRFSLTDWFVNTRLASGSGALRLNKAGMVGIGLNYVSYGTMSRWDEQGNLIGSFSAYDLQGKVTYACDVLRFLSVGAGLSYTGVKVDSSSTGAFGIDLGINARIGWLTAGVAARDFAGTKAPFVKSFGIGVRPLSRLLVTAALEHSGRLALKAGGEFAVSPVSFRAGFDGRNPCFGLGFAKNHVSLDYALLLHSKLGLVHQLSLGVNR